MKRIRLGDVFELETTKGKAYVQFVHDNKDVSELIRILPGLFSECPDLESIVSKKEEFFVHFPLKAAFKKGIVRFVGSFELPDGLKLPQKMRTEVVDNNGDLIGWHIVDYSSWQRESISDLTEDQKALSPWGIWNDTLLADRLASGWSLENWS